MSSLRSDLAADARQAVNSARTFLLSRQDASGIWQDYDLEPGPSDAWTTAYVGWTMLCDSARDRQDSDAIRQAAASIWRLRRPSGWGYNGRTAVDADSSAWSIRFLAACGSLNGLNAASLLGTFLTDSGAACTFGSSERFGSWAAEHAEVTPVVGLAMIAAAADPAIVIRVRRAALDAHSADCGWPSFWWSTPAYSIARNLEFLSRSGGIPLDISNYEIERMTGWPTPASAFECAEYLAIAGLLKSNCAEPLLETLLELQDAQGGWPSSRVLCVPAQRDRSVCTVHEDCRQLFSTATAISAIRLCLEVPV